MKNAKKPILIATSLIVLAFLIWNAIWFFGMRMPYYGYMKYVTRYEEEDIVSYEGEYDGYFLKVKPVGYLSFETGYLCIGTGVLFGYAQTSEQVYIDENLNIQSDDPDGQYEELVNQYRDIIEDLIEKGSEAYGF